MADRIRFVLRGAEVTGQSEVTGQLSNTTWLAAFSPLSSTGRPGTEPWLWRSAAACCLGRWRAPPCDRWARRPLTSSSPSPLPSRKSSKPSRTLCVCRRSRHAITAAPDTHAITAAKRTQPPPLAGTQVCAGGGDARRRGVRPHHGVPAARLRQGVGAGPGQHTHPRGVRRARPRLPRGLSHRGGARVRLHGNRARQSPSIHTAALRNAIACLASSVQPAGHLFSPQRPPPRSAVAPSPRRPCPRHRAS